MADRYLVTALLAGRDGFGCFNDSTWFQMAAGQNGAAAATYWLPNGGTAPLFLTQSAYYTISANGRVLIDYYLTDNTGQDGAGATSARVVLPLTSANYCVWGTGVVVTTGAGALDSHVITGPDALNNIATDIALYTTGSVKVTLAAFADGNRTVSLGGIYTAIT